MTTDNNPPADGSGQPAPEDKKPHPRSPQDQAISNALTQTVQLITKAIDNPEIVALLATRGYTAAELQAGLALQAKAQEAFNKRPTAEGEASNAKKTRDDARIAAREEYMDFRITAQARFANDLAARKALGATGTVSQDIQKFNTQATASYTAALKPPYAAQMAMRGWTADRIGAALAALPDLLKLDNEFNEADSGATASTSGRDSAYDVMNAWVKEFRKIAPLALKRHPEHMATLGL